MLETVTVQSVNPMTLPITGVDPDAVLVCKSISGLTSAKVGLFTGDYASEGSYYQGRRSERLQPTITLKMNPDYANDISVSDLREKLYRTFYEPQPGSDGVKVLLEDDRKPLRYFVGYTDDINTDQWSKTQEAMVTMQCMDAYLFSDAETTAADAAGWASLPIDYDGSAKTGLEATFKVKTASTSMVFRHAALDEYMLLVRAFAVNDIIVINTKKGSRKITVNGVDAMTTLAPASRWLNLRTGVNDIRVFGEALGDGKVVMTSYKYRSQWWGI